MRRDACRSSRPSAQLIGRCVDFTVDDPLAEETYNQSVVSAVTDIDGQKSLLIGCSFCVESSLYCCGKYPTSIISNLDWKPSCSNPANQTFQLRFYCFDVFLKMCLFIFHALLFFYREALPVRIVVQLYNYTVNKSQLNMTLIIGSFKGQMCDEHLPLSCYSRQVCSSRVDMQVPRWWCARTPNTRRTCQR